MFYVQQQQQKQHPMVYTCRPTRASRNLDRPRLSRGRRRKTDSRTNTVANYTDTSLLREAAVYHVYIFINVCIIKYIYSRQSPSLISCASRPIRGERVMDTARRVRGNSRSRESTWKLEKRDFCTCISRLNSRYTIVVLIQLENPLVLLQVNLFVPWKAS